jgi:predicted MPP superfamily phosphohydrolase
VTIALAHNPALWPQLADAGVELTLSGHTHWGQFAIPRLRWSLASVFLEHAMGAYARGNSLLYITPGTGVWGLPLRVGATCEVAFVTLRRGPAAIRTTSRR